MQTKRDLSVWLLGLSVTLWGILWFIYKSALLFEGFEMYGQTYSKYDYLEYFFKDSSDKFMYGVILLLAVISSILTAYFAYQHLKNPTATIDQRSLKEILTPYDRTLSTKNQLVIGILLVVIVVPFLYYMITTFAL